ncbi:hypothetical protein NS2_29640 [Nocardia seriolae NBRC 15557]|nr:hypothetical protein NS2_29640 [Nocardia seriolae NBRC 15557]
MDQPDRADRERHRDAGADEHPLPRFDDDVLGGAQVHARVAFVGAHGYGDAGIEPQQGNRWNTGHVGRAYAFDPAVIDLV